MTCVVCVVCVWCVCPWPERRGLQFVQWVRTIFAATEISDGRFCEVVCSNWFLLWKSKSWVLTFLWLFFGFGFYLYYLLIFVHTQDCPAFNLHFKKHSYLFFCQFPTLRSWRCQTKTWEVWPIITLCRCKGEWHRFFWHFMLQWCLMMFEYHFFGDVIQYGWHC